MNGQFTAVFNKISALHKKNSFSFALIAGDLFADSLTATAEDQDHVTALVDGRIDIPLPTYFALGSHALPEQVEQKLDAAAGEVCPNLYFLGKRTTIKTAEGVRIVGLGGALDSNLIGISKDKYHPFYNEDDARALKGANNADILVTSQWPADIRTGSKVDFVVDGSGPSHQQCIADLCSTLKPRYHFSTSPNAFFEREPFFHAPSEGAPDGYPITRFISLASYNNPKKQKWIYAFSIDPTVTPPLSIPAGTTASPLSFVAKKRVAPADHHSHRLAADNTQQHRRTRKRPRAPAPTPAECFFCLSNPTVATHLIASIGTDAYLTTAKGPLTTAHTFPALPFPAHMLIIPLAHAPTLASMEPDVRASTYAEMARYRRALQRMLLRCAGGKLGAVAWEVSRTGGIHTHWQVLPVPAELIRRGLVDAAVKVEAENERYPAVREKDVGDGAEEGRDFFRMVVWEPPEGEDGSEDAEQVGGREKHLMLSLDESFRFDLQFGRRVMAKLLGLEGRMHWQDCGQSHEDEVGDVEAFKKAFKPFDFSLEE